MNKVQLLLHEITKDLNLLRLDQTYQKVVKSEITMKASFHFDRLQKLDNLEPEDRKDRPDRPDIQTRADRADPIRSPRSALPASNNLNRQDLEIISIIDYCCNRIIGGK